MTNLAADARAIYTAALEGVNPLNLLRRAKLDRLVDKPLASFAKIRIAAIGKATIPFSVAIEEVLAGLEFEGLGVVPHGYKTSLPAGISLPRKIEILEAGHPVPDEAGREAAARILAMAKACDDNDLFIVLLSGGGSALCPAFAGGIPLDDARSTFECLLRSGAAIHEVNTVRKHISLFSGGRLAAAGFRATTRTLVISDVPGDDLSVISSGPTVSDPTTFADADAVLEKYNLNNIIPRSVRAFIDRGLAEDWLETPKPGDPRLARATTHLIGANAMALDAAAVHARSLGYEVQVNEKQISGEAREVGRGMAEIARRFQSTRPLCLVCGGETTVTVKGDGRGGRNQELALAAALALEGSSQNIAILSGGSDGIDGPTDAAGAVVTPQTLDAVRAKKLSPESALANNDAYPLLDAAGALLRPGPTHANVMDVILVLVAP